ncbi:MAG: hypothetical protein IJM18_08170, partial [Clostridia bacterium]|nr:hypothetical protein [Clostridia bacterium]
MSLISFSKAMLGDDLTEIGFKKKKGTKWVKIVDRSVFMAVSTRSLYGLLEIQFSIEPLYFHFCIEKSMVGFYAGLLALNGTNCEVPNIMIPVLDENTEAGKRVIEKGRQQFRAIKPMLERVVDLESALSVLNEIDYIPCKSAFTQRLGREYTIEEHTVFQHEKGFFILCKLGRYQEAAEYLRQSLYIYPIRIWNEYSDSKEQE